MKMMLDDVITSKKTGGPNMGVLFWNVVLHRIGYHDGYDIFIDGGGKGRKLLEGHEGALPSPVVTLEPYLHRDVINSTAPFLPHHDPPHDQGDDITDAMSEVAGHWTRHLHQDRLGFFRQEDARMRCAARSYKTWSPLFKLTGVVDLEAYKRSTRGQSDMDVLRNGAWGLRRA